MELRECMPAGRPSGTSTARERLLSAAVETFADKGYESASIRMITDKIGVDPALVRHYFGDKEGLFRAAVIERVDAQNALGAALDGNPDTLGERLVRAYLSLWIDPRSASTMQAMLRSALDSSAARDHVERDLQLRLTRSAEATPNKDRKRLALAGSHLLGLAMARHILCFEPLASMSVDEIATTLGPVIQQLLHTP